jgi:hypothetical protein
MNYRICIVLLTSMLSISCGDGNGSINVDIDGDGFPFIVPVTNTDFEAKESFSFEREAGNSVQLTLTGETGEIMITGNPNADTVVVTGVRRVRSSSTQDAEEHLQELQVDLQELGDEILVKTIQPQNEGGRKYEVDYMIDLPRNSVINITNTNGTIKVEFIDNDIIVDNLNGNVTLLDVAGSASVDLVNGNIESEVTLPAGGSIDMSTVNGNIELSVPTNTSAELSAAVTIGAIRVLNLALQNEVETSTSLSGTLGGGQGTIRLEAEVTGSIGVSGT